jgi:hypothetical protein
MKLKYFLVSIFFIFFIGAGLVGNAMGQDANLKDLKSYSCKDIMRLSGEDRDLAIGVLHAFLLGKNGTTQFDVQKLGESTDKFIEYCLDNPKDNALESMEKLTQ